VENTHFKNDFTFINFTFAPGVSKEQMLCFEIAGAIWSQYLVDPVTVNIYVEAVNLDTDLNFGQTTASAALPGMASKNIAQVVASLKADATSTFDQTSTDTLTGFGKEFNILADKNTLKMKDVSYSKALGKAMGLIKPDEEKLDGYILVNQNLDWNCDQSVHSLAQNKIDCVSVALHEIGHCLGVISGADHGDLLYQQEKALGDCIESIIKDKNYKKQIESGLGKKEKEIKDWLKTMKGRQLNDFLAQIQKITGITNEQVQEKYLKPVKIDKTNFAIMDLYRYSENSFRQGISELGSGMEVYFSIDGGNTAIANLADGETDQASHWKHDEHDQIGIMDPMIALGESRTIHSTDLLLLDVMGWNLRSDLIADGIVTDEELAFDFQQLVSNVTHQFYHQEILQQDRSKDVNKMIEESQYYDWRWRGSYGQKVAQNFLNPMISINKYDTYTLDSNINHSNMADQVTTISSGFNQSSDLGFLVKPQNTYNLPVYQPQITKENNQKIVDLDQEFWLTPNFKTLIKNNAQELIDNGDLPIPSMESEQDSSVTTQPLDQKDIELIKIAYADNSDLQVVFDELLGYVLSEES
jgi:hypothetical protein